MVLENVASDKIRREAAPCVIVFESVPYSPFQVAVGAEVEVERWSAPIKVAVIFERCGFAC